MKLFNWYYSFTPRHWEFGLGFFLANAALPTELSFMFGPFSLGFEFGRPKLVALGDPHILDIEQSCLENVKNYSSPEYVLVGDTQEVRKAYGVDKKWTYTDD